VQGQRMSKDKGDFTDASARHHTCLECDAACPWLRPASRSVRCTRGGCSVVSGRPLRSRAVAGLSRLVCVCLGPVLASHAPSPLAAAAAAYRGRGRVLIAGWSYGGVGPERVSGGEEEGGGVRSGPGEARTILLLHIISVRPSKQPLMLHHHQHGGLGIGLGSRTLERAGR